VIQLPPRILDSPSTASHLGLLLHVSKMLERCGEHVVSIVLSA